MEGGRKGRGWREFVRRRGREGGREGGEGGRGGREGRGVREGRVTVIHTGGSQKTCTKV